MTQSLDLNQKKYAALVRNNMEGGVYEKHIYIYT